MSPILRNILAVIVGVIIGGAINMGIISISGALIPPPEGVNPNDIESLKASMGSFGPKHFIFPFLAHALNSLVGVFLTAFIAINHKMKFALGIGAFVLLGGIAAAFMLPAPTWFEILDLTLAYIPMAWLGGKIAIGFAKK